MLNNERAALATCRDINKRLKREGKIKWIDESFGPTDKFDRTGNAMALYKAGMPEEKGMVLPDEVEWLHSEQLCASDKKP